MKKIVLSMPSEFGDGVSRVVWDPTEGPFYLCDPKYLDLEPNSRLEIVVKEMTQEEIDNLPEI